MSLKKRRDNDVRRDDDVRPAENDSQISFSRRATNHLFINFSFMIQLANLFIN